MLAGLDNEKYVEAADTVEEPSSSQAWRCRPVIPATQAESGKPQIQGLYGL